jgi:hypothetical protein
MDAKIQTLLDAIHGTDHESRCISLTTLGDRLEYGRNFAEADVVTIVNQLVAVLAVETEVVVRQSLFSVISIAFMHQSGLEDVDMSPLIARLPGATSHQVMLTLYLCSMTRNARYRPLMEGYLDDANKLVRAEAAKSLGYLRG